MHQAKYTLTQLVTYRKMYKCIVTLEDNIHMRTHTHTTSSPSSWVLAVFFTILKYV